MGKDGRGRREREKNRQGATVSVPQHLALSFDLVIEVMIKPKTACLKRRGKLITSDNAVALGMSIQNSL